MIYLTISLIILIGTIIINCTNSVEICPILLEFSLINIVVYCIKDLQNRIVLLFFTIAFFVLLASRLVISRYFDVSSFIYQTKDELFGNLLIDVYSQLIVAINFVFIFYFIFSWRNQAFCSYSFDSDGVKAIRNCSKKLVYFCFLFSVFAIYKRIYGVLNGGYLALYMAAEDLDIPFYVSLFAGKFELCSCLFFATMPSKKECKVPLTLYILNAILSLFTGVRGNFVIPAMFVILYLYLRNYIPNRNDIWLPGRVMLIGFVLTPLFFVLMYMVMNLRGGNDTESGSIMNLFLGSVYQLGSSVQVIHDTIYYHDDLIKQNFYSLEPLIDFIVHNPFTDWFLDIPRYEPQSVDMAVHGRSLGSSVTYLSETERYLMGGSMGSSYVAESWIDFGYWGIIFYSSIYGIVLGSVIRFCRKNFFCAFLALYSMMQIIYAPRALTTAFISRFIEVKAWPFLLLVYISYRISTKRSQHKRFTCNLNL